MNWNKAQVMLLLITFASGMTAQAATTLPGDTMSYPSPGGIEEACIAIKEIPGGEYSPKDKDKEKDLCSINFYAPNIELCPKENSTSPGTRIYEMQAGETKDSARSKYCSKKEYSSLGKFKQTMNESGTSGTYSLSPIVYYHLSRYFHAYAYVSPAVYRTMDLSQHFNLVTKYSRHACDGEMIDCGWDYMYKAETDPQHSVAAPFILTADHKSIYGNIEQAQGERYGTEINGIRGVEQETNFLKTPAFMALNSSLPLAQAIVAGEKAARRDPQINSDLGAQAVPKEQMLSWMRELIDITLLDYILSQQDRVGNIDFTVEAVYTEGGVTKLEKVKTKSKISSRQAMFQVPMPDDLKGKNAVLIQRSHINDNDAGVRVEYGNYTKSTNMIDGIRHYNAQIYQRLIALDEDLKSKGPIYQYFNSNFGLPPDEVKQLVDNTDMLVVKVLQKNCQAGLIQFDLNPDHIGQLDKVDCQTGKIQ